MIKVNAIDAQQLQKAGYPQHEALEKAFERCELAIIDQSKRGKSSVEVAVFCLSDENFEKLKMELIYQKFELLNPSRFNDSTHVVTICWQKKLHLRILSK